MVRSNRGRDSGRDTRRAVVALSHSHPSHRGFGHAGLLISKRSFPSRVAEWLEREGPEGGSAEVESAEEPVVRSRG